MYENLSDQSREVVERGREVARELHNNYIGSDHLLAGLLRVDGVAQTVLNNAGVDQAVVHEEMLFLSPYSDRVNQDSSPPLTPKAQEVLSVAFHQSVGLGHNQVEPEHILLGLLRDSFSFASRLMDRRGIDSQEVKAALLAEISKPTSEIA